jgi:hypothetical protein
MVTDEKAFPASKTWQLKGWYLSYRFMLSILTVKRFFNMEQAI